LQSSFRLDYPNYEVIFCAAREDDPVVPIVRRVIAANRHIPAALLVGDDRDSVNPKLNNLIKGWDAARHSWIVMADSNVLMPRDYVQRLLGCWRPHTGAVCSMPIGSMPGNFWAELECAFLNTLQARAQYMSETVGWGFAQGKTMLFRRDVVENGGGIRALAAETAEDAATTKLIRNAGLHVHLVDNPFEQPLGWRSAAEVWARQVRWARLRRISFSWLFLPELLVGSVFPALALAIAADAHGFSVTTSLSAFLAMWFAAEITLACVAGWRLSLPWLLALPIRDLLLPILWIAAWLSDDFIWRGNPMTVSRNRRRRRRILSRLLPGGIGDRHLEA
jgi:ceramide glucosyltransferase